MVVFGISASLGDFAVFGCFVISVDFGVFGWVSVISFCFWVVVFSVWVYFLTL